MILQMPLPVPQAVTSSVSEGEIALKDATLSSYSLSTRKAMSLDVHVPSLRQKPIGVWGWVKTTYYRSSILAY
jgi:regulator of telomere elongation helicase 1